MIAKGVSYTSCGMEKVDERKTGGNVFWRVRFAASFVDTSQVSAVKEGMLLLLLHRLP